MSDQSAHIAEPQPPMIEDHTAPRSLSGLLGAIGFVLSVLWVCKQPMARDHRILICLAATAGPMILFDLLWLRVHRRPSAGIHQAPGAIRWDNVALKSAGLLLTIGAVAAAYGIFKEYHGAFYNPFWGLLRHIALPFAALTVPYIAWTDARMANPRDGYWHVGAAVLGPLLGVSRDEVDRGEIYKHARAWLVKAFFWPLMIVYLSQNLTSVALKMRTWQSVDSFTRFYDLAWLGMYTVDVGFAAVGYAMTFRLFDAQTRSAEPTLIGWGLCLMCYQPFWGVAGKMYLSYDDGHSWGHWLLDQPLIHNIWGSSILLLTFIYMWATVTFGLRFSNLTHRGILTFGPYRWLRHPAYVSKNLSWWLVTIPFIPTSGWTEALRACSALLLVNVVYAARAWTEERHLGMDAAYRAYQQQTPWVGERARRWLAREDAT